MFTLALAFVPLMLSAAPAPTSAQDAGAAAPKPTREELETLLDGLRERTGKLRSFVVRYDAPEDTGDATLEMVYVAPDRARLALRLGDMQLTTWSRDGRITLRGAQPGGAIRADFSPREMLAPYQECATIFRAELGGPQQPSGPDDPGLFFAVELTSNPKDPHDANMNVLLAWDSRRTYFLSWLARVEPWIDAAREGDLLVAEPVEGCRVALDLESGFLREIRGKRGVFHLKQLTLDGEVPDAEFEPAAADPAARDMSAAYAEQFERLTRTRFRDEAFRAAVRAGEAEGGPGADYDGRLATVFHALHAVIAVHQFASWMERAHAGIDEYAARCRKEREAQGDDAAARAALAKRIAEHRAELAAETSSGAEQYVHSLAAAPKVEGGAGLLARIRAAEDAAARSVLAEKVTGPVLAHWDTALGEFAAPK